MTKRDKKVPMLSSLISTIKPITDIVCSSSTFCMVKTKDNIADVFGVNCEILPKTNSDHLRIFIRDSIITKKREIKNDKE